MSEGFVSREKQNEESKQRFIAYQTEVHGFHLMRTGQHHYEPHDEVLRHAPNTYIIECGAWVHVRWALSANKWPTVIAPIDSFEGSREFLELNSRSLVWAIWELPGSLWYGNYIQKLDIFGNISKEARANGSGTPAYRFLKKSLRPFEELVNEVRVHGSSNTIPGQLPRGIAAH